MRITNSNFYFITFTALAALLIIGLYFFSRKDNCCGDCHVHGEHAAEQVIAETPAVAEQPTVEATAPTENSLQNIQPDLAQEAATQNLK